MTLDEARELAMALPEVEEQPHHHLTSFRVRGKIFATAPPEGTHLHIMLLELDARAAAADDPAAFEILPWGKKIAGIRALLAGADPVLVRGLLEVAWRAKVPRSLACKLPGGER